MMLAALCLVWAGMVLGISFLEALVKFTAPSLTLAVGLDVGRHVFGMFNKVEIALALAACALLIGGRSGRGQWLPLGAAVLIVAVQSLWLLPVLDARVGLILSGQMPPPAPYHVIYVVLEVLKLAGLLAAGAASLRNLRGARSLESL